MTQPQLGDMAPDFLLPSDDAEPISLASLKGNPVVLYFYPKDDTSGCTKEAIDFSRLKPEFAALGIRIIGMSPDNVEKHAKFRKKHELTIDLASDEEKNTLTAYGVWVEKSMYGRKYMGVERTTFLIDADGHIAHVWNKVKVTGHADQVLETARTILQNPG